MSAPEFITFTGADDLTDVVGMMAISERYPVEWGILLSRSRQGEEPRYPRDPSRFLGCRLHLAAHLCGAYSREVMAGDFARLPFLLRSFERVQVNHRTSEGPRVRALQEALGRPCIAQRRQWFPVDDSIAWLFDASGGRGIAPSAWPAHPGDGRRVGYAGGISPGNVREAIAAIGSTGPYWIDMESGVRTDDRFDLSKCRAVCEAVYPAPAAPTRAPNAAKEE